MKTCAVLLTALASLVTPSRAGTVFVGFDDAVGLDYDYQDLVVSLSSNSLKIHSAATWKVRPGVLTAPADTGDNGGLQNAPFWNQTSSDGASFDIGFCIYGGGNCNGGIALDSTANYLAVNTSSTGSANDVTFSSLDPVDASILIRLAGGADVFGWYSLTAPNNVHWLNSRANPLGNSTFSPNGDFGLIGQNQSLNFTFQSDMASGSPDVVSHFAFFSDPIGFADTVQSPTPEPNALLLCAASLAVLGGLMYRSRKS